MTHYNTARINEMLGLQVSVIKAIALRLESDNLEELEINLTAMEDAITNLRSMVEGLPHQHQS